ncbi:PIM1 kinase, partial [Amia calva]|nr:PIM1 kinase [Amia calva]
MQTVRGKTVKLPRELLLMQRVGTDAGVIQLLDFFELPNEYLLVLERPEPCPDLFSYARDRGNRLDEDQATDFPRQLVQTLQLCHERGVLHRDVKPENILVQLDTGDLKLLDFGCGCDLQDSVYSTFSGTPHYTPPEWIQHSGYRGVPDTVRSLGVLLFAITCGDLPFQTDEEIVQGVLGDFPAELTTVKAEDHQLT